jgi:hypothetical protein
MLIDPTHIVMKNHKLKLNIQLTTIDFPIIGKWIVLHLF